MWMRQCFQTKPSQRLQVDQAFWGSEVRAQGHIRVLQLFEDTLVELLPHTVELHDVQRILVNPELVEFMHQVAYQGMKNTEKG